MKTKPAKATFTLPFYIRASIQLLQKIHPLLATPLALKLFYTPLRFSTPPREKKIRSEANIHRLQTENKEFTVFEWAGTGPKVILMHGWCGRASQFYSLIKSLRESGFAVYAVEAPGHGENEMEKSNLYHFMGALRETKKHFGSFKLAVGHSLGAVAIVNIFASAGIPLVTYGSPASIRNMVTSFCNTIGASSDVQREIIRSIEKRYNVNIDEVAPKYLLKKYQPQGLLFHCKNDEEVPMAEAHEILQSWTMAEPHFCENHGHRRILRNPQFIEKVLALLKH